MIKYKLLGEASILFVLGHLILWYQANAQFFSVWGKNHKILLALLLGPPVSYLFITGVGMVASAMSGDIWATRILPSMIGTIVFMIMTYLVFSQGIDLKNGVCLLLSLAVIFIQAFWR
jgi:hypothetical protein